MAMLAGPKRRNRYNLTPRGKALYEDDTRFGTKMLEKMGWSKGKGLGARENGSQDFVRVRMRNTNEGLGFEDRDDLWTQHEQSFSGLLKTLNVDDDDSGGKAEETNASEEGEITTVGFGVKYTAEASQKIEKLKDKFSGESLEEKSKRSKARVHYKKFTKGKDLSQYSEKDLANIFGKKVVEEQQANGIYEQFSAITVVQKSDEKDEKKVDANFAGVSTIETKLSVTDYFKLKMEEMKNRRKHLSAPQLENTMDWNYEQEERVAYEESVSIENSGAFKEQTIQEGNKSPEVLKKKKRKLNESKDEDEEQIHSLDETETKVLKKKRKGKKVNEVIPAASVDNSEENVRKEDEEIQSFEETESKVLKKKRKKANEVIAATSVNNDEENIEKSLSKRPKKKVSVDDEVEIDNVELLINLGKSIKKSKRKKIEDKSLSELSINSKKETGNSYANSEEINNKNSISENNIEVMVKTKKFKNRQEVAKIDDQQETTEYTPTIIAPRQTENESNKNKDTNKTVIDFSSLTLDELKAKFTTYNSYTISQFCAEKFRNIDFDMFKGSTLSQIPGYSFNEDLKLDIKVIKGDEDRITNLWNCNFNKYSNSDPKGTYYNYIKQVKTARKAKKRMPRFSVKTWKRKNAFQGI